MAYSNFTLETVRATFDIEEVDDAGIFADSEPVAPSELLTAVFWRFLKLEEKKLYIDMTVYQIAQCDKILGILTSMVKQKA